MKSKIITLSVGLMAAGVACAALKDAYRDKFVVGAALSADVFTGEVAAEAAAVAAEFSTITAENEMKPERVQPQEGVFTWDLADKFVAFGEKNKMKIIGHCLVWHYQTPDWFFKNPDGSKADRETLIKHMRDHIHAVVGRYKGRVHGWDVVNEAFDDGGNLHPSPWRDGIGDDFVELAFRFAHEADPNAELYYNDFNMFNANKAAGVLKMARAFRAKGVRIDGIGLQSHNGLGGPRVEDYEATIRAIGREGLKAMVTELDVSVLPSTWGMSADIQKLQDYNEKYNPYVKGVPAEKLAEQAKRYTDLFTMYLRNADVIDRVTVWGASDRNTWLNDYPMPGRTDYPLFLDKNGKAKPCLTAVEKLGRGWKGTTNSVPPEAKVNSARFLRFRIDGKDDLPACDERTQYRNPIITGMAPDPSFCRKGQDYYLANSSFGYFPGIPVWHSRDLQNWDFCGYVQSRKSQLDMKSWLDLNHGVYAPDIKYNPHNDTFYMIVSVVSAGGTMIYKTKDPYLGWSEPIRVAVPEIDPAIYFEDAETAYIVHNDVAPASGEEYPGHRTIRMRKYDLTNDKLVEGYEKILVNKGVKPEDKPIWCEGPHLYKIDGTYYLMTAEGGTGYNHSEVVYRSDAVDGPYVPCKVNPILTQRDLPYGRKDGVYCAGHADLLQTPTGDWMAVFLGILPYNEVKGGDNSPTGRNTFMLPVTWIGKGKDRQPLILEKGKPIPLVVDKPKVPGVTHAVASASKVPGVTHAVASASKVPGVTSRRGVGKHSTRRDSRRDTGTPLSGNHTFEDRFTTPRLDPLWIQLRTPDDVWYRSADGGRPGVTLEARKVSLYERGNPSYLCRWLKNRNFDVKTVVEFDPKSSDELAGLALQQHEKCNYVLGKTLDANGRAVVTLVRHDNGGKKIVATAPLAKNGRLALRCKGKDVTLRFFWSEDGKNWTAIGGEEKADVLTTATAGGFIGATVGLYATSAAGKE